jgi:hypothetical protein
MHIGSAQRAGKEAHYLLLRERLPLSLCELQKDIPSVLGTVEHDVEQLLSVVMGFICDQATKRDHTTCTEGIRKPFV